MRGKRGSNSTPLSLFSFQDIITSVMGILLFIVLMMALQMKIVANAVAQSSPEDPIPPAIEAAVAKEKVAAQEAEIEQLREILGQSSAQSRDRIVALRARLQSLYDQIGELDERTASSYEEVLDRVKDDKVLADGIRREQDLLKLRKELEEAKLARRLTYIANQDFPKQPLIVELDRNGMRFAPSAGADDTTSLPGNESVRFKQLHALLAGYAPDAYYVLFVMKPSAMTAETRKLIDAVKALGYQHGEDVIPEDWSAVFGETK